MSAPVLAVRGLRVAYPGLPEIHAVDGLDLEVRRGECLGILGESGSGKSSFARALLGLLSEARVEGSVLLDGRDLSGLDEAGWREVRWRRIALSFQSTAALNPVLRVVDQVAEPLRAHLGLDRASSLRRAQEALDAIGLDHVTANRYPSELSGGQRRLALLAMAAICEPDLLVLDEPTAGLDAVTREHVAAFLRSLAKRRDVAIVLLGHDVEVLSGLADRVAILYRGWLAELGPTAAVLDDPRHPYTRGLLGARPTLATIRELRGIRGRPPDPAERTPGCPFQPRCTQAAPECEHGRPPLAAPAVPFLDGRLVGCVRGGVVELLRASGLRKQYRSRGRQRVQAVDGVGLEVVEGEVVGVVGSTGAGKSTLALLLTGLLRPDTGSVVFEGLDLSRPDALHVARRRLQLVFQDPFESLSQRLTIGAAVREPLEVQRRGGDASSRDVAVRRALDAVRLRSDDAFVSRRTHELSGGELQRVALARALVLEPKLLVLDEPVAMLDPSEQAELLQLLKALQVDRGMAMVLVSHDLATILRVADRVVVLDQGRVVEEANGTALLVAPHHPASRALLAAAGRDAIFRDAIPEPAAPLRRLPLQDPSPQEVVR